MSLLVLPGDGKPHTPMDPYIAVILCVEDLTIVRNSPTGTMCQKKEKIKDRIPTVLIWCLTIYMESINNSADADGGPRPLCLRTCF